MLFSLVKKDFLIVKKYVGIMLIVSFLIPPIMLWRTPEAAGAMGFTLTIIFSIFMLTQYVSLKEHQYPLAIYQIGNLCQFCITPFFVCRVCRLY
jgi:ABC-2 type transport system permease protein